MEFGRDRVLVVEAAAAFREHLIQILRDGAGHRRIGSHPEKCIGLRAGGSEHKPSGAVYCAGVAS